jgi:formylglycine-generating enzyme required for sulfatase activity
MSPRRPGEKLASARAGIFDREMQRCWWWILALAGCDASGAAPAEDAPPAQASVAESGSASAPPVAASAPTAVASAEPTCEPACGAIESCKAGKCEPSCPAGEVYIPPTGPKGFVMGAGMRSADVPHNVVLTRPFCMDATEVTVKAYKECVDAGKCEPPRLWGKWISYPTLTDHPVNKVHWRHAMAYCAWRNQTLPTEAQWEWAASGGDGRMWAWGNEHPTCEHADYTAGELRTPSSDDGCHGGGSSPVGAHPKGDTIWPSGRLHDMSGNVWEWCLDNYQPWRRKEDAVDPLFKNNENGNHVVRGGGWNRSDVGIRVQFRASSVVDYQVPGLGFRCVRNP